MATVTLTERRKADRAIMAGHVAELARQYELTAVVTGEQHGSRQVSVEITGPHTLGLTMRFCGSSPHAQPDTYVLSWHMRPWTDEGQGWRLAPQAFGNVNPYHRIKATDVVYGFCPLIQTLTRRFKSIADGSAYEAQDTKGSK